MLLVVEGCCTFRGAITVASKWSIVMRRRIVCSSCLKAERFAVGHDQDCPEVRRLFSGLVVCCFYAWISKRVINVRLVFSLSHSFISNVFYASLGQFVAVSVVAHGKRNFPCIVVVTLCLH